MKKTNESGRSMVEMLGVLAIIGVLSIGGIAGYTLAMNRYRANEVLDAASKVAIIAMSMNGGTGGDADLSKLGTNYTVPTISGSGYIKSNKNGIVSIKLDTGYSEVKDLIETMASGRLSTDEACEDDKDICLDMNKGVTSSSSSASAPVTSN